MHGFAVPTSPIHVRKRPHMMMFCLVAWLCLWNIFVPLATPKTKRKLFMPVPMLFVLIQLLDLGLMTMVAAVTPVIACVTIPVLVHVF